MMAVSKSIPRPVIARFPKYLACLQQMRKTGREWTTSRELAGANYTTTATVRQDISHLDFSGAGRGYEIEELRRAITHTLRLEKPATTVIGGGGELGRVLAINLNWDSQPPAFNICGIFDWDPDVVGTRIGKRVVRNAERLPGVVRNKSVEIGIVATSAIRAQAMVDLLASAGVRGVMNLSPAQIAVPEGLLLLDVSVRVALQKLVYEVRAGAGSGTTD